jgi:uncharacterized protein
MPAAEIESDQLIQIEGSCNVKPRDIPIPTQATPNSANVEPIRRVLRASSYTIYVDLPGNQEEMLLVHGYTGAYDKVSRSVATYIRSLETHRVPKPLYGTWSADPAVSDSISIPSEDTLRLLKTRGYLTRLSNDEEEKLFTRLAEKIHQQRLTHAPTYLFMPTYNCNLRCSYCFQDHMRTDPKFHHLLRTMSRSQVDQAFLGMKQIEQMHGVHETNVHRSIGFFGGEPLLGQNRPIVEYIIQKGLELGTARFWAVTNATELYEFKDLLTPEKLSGLQITLDGPPAEHDQRRIYADGSGSFARIAQNITMALDLGVGVNVRMNVDRTNLDQLPLLAEVIHANGWQRYPNFSAYSSPIRAMNNNVPVKTTLTLFELSQAQLRMVNENPMVAIIGRPDADIKHKARSIFVGNQDPTSHLRESYCGAHTGMYIFDSFGDIYTCWDKTGDPSIRIGHIHEDGSVKFNSAHLQLWQTRTVASNPVCRKCRYAFHCGGGCAVLAYRRSGEYHSNYCDGFASTFRSSVAEAYMDHLAGVAMADKAVRVCDE